MIKYALRCEPDGHAFDAWFRSGADYDRQAGADLVSCPACGATSIGKGLMRPAVAAVRSDVRPAEVARVLAELQEVTRQVRTKADYVGPRFAEEARRIHHGETEVRHIYGEASTAEVKSLADDGITALPLVPLPEDKN